jgi:G6PDH family F420-dependent oxidoreductase
VRIGYKLFAEVFSPQELVAQAVRAEEAGFDFVEISDHYHPWLFSHDHSGFAWSILGTIAAGTKRIELATGVTCPFLRYHPAIVAQAAATTALLCDGRFTLGVGAGERLNEHVVGRGWPAAGVRHEMLREALEIIRLLWSGGYRSYRGRHLTLEDARVFDLPDTPPRIAVAAGGSPSPSGPSTAPSPGGPPAGAPDRRTPSAPARPAPGSGPRPAGPARPRPGWPGPGRRPPGRRCGRPG